VTSALMPGVSMFRTVRTSILSAKRNASGQAIKGRRDKVLISTKALFVSARDRMTLVASRQHLLAAVDGSLGRLGTDYIDLSAPWLRCVHAPEEVLATLDALVRAGRSAMSASRTSPAGTLMKSLALLTLWLSALRRQPDLLFIDRTRLTSGAMPLGLDQGLGAVVWSPLGWGRLTGKIRRDQPRPAVSRLPQTADMGPPVPGRARLSRRDAMTCSPEKPGKAYPDCA